MSHEREFYIGGAWVRPASSGYFEVVNPATEEVIGTVASADQADVERAVAAAAKALPGYSRTTTNERIELLESILAVLERRYGEMAELTTLEMGAPVGLAMNIHGKMTKDHFPSMIEVLRGFSFKTRENDADIMREAIGVCGIITPWNAPGSQIAGKVVPALAAGCTVVVKPSELAPLSPLAFADIMHEAGVPAGVFNLVNGAGETGACLSSHPDVAMVSFTGSTRTGIAVSKAAADTLKRVHLELGGKGANVILADADLEKAVRNGVMHCFANSGQVCSAPTRMLVPEEMHDEVVNLAKTVAEGVVVGPPEAEGTMLGPLSNRAQFEKVQDLIRAGIEEGGELVTGGVGRPAGLNRGFYARPTIFARVTPEMTIAKTEIFGPVLSIMPYGDEEGAIAIANGTVYGLSAYVSSKKSEHAAAVGARLEAGLVTINYAPRHPAVPFGGYKQSGNGRQNGVHGLMEYLEIKALVGR